MITYLLIGLILALVFLSIIQYHKEELPEVDLVIAALIFLFYPIMIVALITTNLWTLWTIGLIKLKNYLNKD